MVPVHLLDAYFVPLNSLQYEKILSFTKLKMFGENKLNVAQIMISVFVYGEDIVEKGENIGHQRFLLFPRECGVKNEKNDL